MSKRIADLTCPECNKAIQVPFEEKDPPTLEEITSALKEQGSGQPGQIEEVLKRYGITPPKTEDHRHKTADDFVDCPECSDWFNKTATKHKIVPAEEPKPDPVPDPVPEPAIGSIFEAKGGEGGE